MTINANLYVAGTGWHTQIYVPANDLQGGMRDFAAPGAANIGFGFGQRGYMLPKRTTAFGDLRAFLHGFVPSRGIVIVTWLNTTPRRAWGARHVVGLHASAAQLARLNAAIWRSFTRHAGKPVYLEQGFYPGSAFYASSRRYDFAFTCNTWTNAMLHAGGLPVSGDGVIFASQTMSDARILASGYPGSGR